MRHTSTQSITVFWKKMVYNHHRLYFWIWNVLHNLQGSSSLAWKQIRHIIRYLLGSRFFEDWRHILLLCFSPKSFHVHWQTHMYITSLIEQLWKRKLLFTQSSFPNGKGQYWLPAKPQLLEFDIWITSGFPTCFSLNRCQTGLKLQIFAEYSRMKQLAE